MDWKLTLGMVFLVAFALVAGAFWVSESSECADKGGVLIQDAAGMPRCVKGAAIILNTSK
jgi:hypothetical protein